MRALMDHDGGNVAMSRNGGWNIHITQINELTNAGIRFARSHSWEEIIVKSAVKSSWIFLPYAFHGYDRIAAAVEHVNVQVYWSLLDICETLKKESSVGACIFVSPTTVGPIEENHWSRLTTGFAAQARQDTKVVSVCGPRSERAWELNRHKTIEMFELMREAAAASSSNVVTMFGQTPAFAEPCVAMGSGPRMGPDDAYSVHLIKEFLESLKAYVGGHIHQPVFEFFERPISRAKFYKYKKQMEKQKAHQALRSIGRAEDNASQVPRSDAQFSHGMRGQGSSRERGRWGCGHPRGHDNNRGRPRGRWVLKLY